MKLFQLEHFYDAENTGEAVIKSPVQLVVQAVRSLHSSRDLGTLHQACELMPSLFNPPSAGGWEARPEVDQHCTVHPQNILLYFSHRLRQ